MTKKITLIILSLLLPFIIQAQDWTELGKVLPTPRPANNGYDFGESVAVDGNYAVVGVPDATSGYAYVYFYNGTSWERKAKLSALDNEEDNHFGYSVAISGDNIVIGAYYNDDPGNLTDRGAVYVFTKPSSGWTDMTETAKLSASDAANGDRLGCAVSISGDYIVASTYYKNSYTGAAYVYKKPTSGWVDTTETAILTASDGAGSDRFGYSVSISGDNIVIGAYLDDDAANNSGSAYVFTKPAGGWINATETAKLTLSDGAADDYFGNSVSISGDNIVIGAYYKPSPRTNGGVVYVFTKPVAGWATTSTPTAKLLPSNLENYKRFGKSVSINGDVVIVSDDATSNTTYIYKMPASGGWVDATENAQLDGTDEDNYDSFGNSICVSDEHIVIGSKLDDDIVKDCGSAYFFKKPSGDWANATENQKVIDDTVFTNLEDHFGNDIAVDGNYAVIGAYYTTLNQSRAGCAFVYYFDGTNWIKKAKLIASDPSLDDYFGQFVSISGDNIVIGVPNEEHSGYSTGAVYVFTKPSSGWVDMTETAKLTASDITNYAYFGMSVDILDDIIVVGARGKNSNTGGAYIFKKPVSGWVSDTEDYMLNPSDGGTNDYFGWSISISENDIVVGAKGSKTLYVYTKPVSGWATSSTETARLTASDGSTLGESVYILDDNIISMGDQKAYIFTKSGSAWVTTSTQTAILSISGNTNNIGKQGNSMVLLQGNLAFVSDVWENEFGSGAVMVYEKPETGWEDMSEMKKIVSSDNASGDYFGSAIAISGKYLIAGACNDDDNGESNVGSAYFYAMPAPGVNAPSTQDNICSGSSVDFTVTATYADSYQWQVSTNNGSTFTNISESAPYSGTNTKTLTVSTDNSMDAYQYRCVVTNLSGSTNSSSATLNMDSEAPVISSTHDDKIVSDAGNCQANLPDYTGDLSATDNCTSVGNLTITQSPVAGTSISGGSNTVTLRVADEIGNYSEVSFNVAVFDNTNPVISSTHDNLEVDANSSCQANLADYTGDLVVTDNCDNNLTITQSPAAGTTISGTSNTITLRATDYAGNYSEVTFNVSVVDNTNPDVTAIEDKNIDANASCTAILPNYISTVVASDNCDGNLAITQTPASGTSISGTTTVTMRATDDAGNYTEVTFDITVVDNTNPWITSTHDDLEVDANSSCQASLPNYTGDLAVTDNCDASLDITQLPAAGTTISGTTNEITLRATDDAGNYSEVSFNVAVVDNTNPDVDAINDKEVDANSSCQASLLNYTGIIDASDNCDNDLTITQTPTAGTTISGGTNSVTLRATDDAGNYTEVSFNVAVVDNTNPDVDAINDKEVEANSNCQVVLADYTGDIVATDNCDNDLTISQSPVAGTTISGTTNEITLRATDDAGNYTEETFNLAVVDNTNPDVDAFTNKEVDANSSCQANLPDYTGDLDASDDCDANLEITQSPAAGTTISGVTNSVTLKATDDAGNYTEVTFNVSVVDNTEPDVTAIGNKIISDAGSCQAVLPDYTGDVIASDNCDASLDITQSPVAGTTISGASNTVTITVTDDAGNYSEITFNVAIEDTTDPTITCVGNQAVDANSFHVYVVNGTEFDPTATDDNCGIASVINDFNSSNTLANAQLPEGMNTIEWTITDNGGNTAVCSYTITVNTYVGIDDIAGNEISVYPNPTNGIFNIETSKKPLNIEITDITGKSIYSSNSTNNNAEIDLSNKASGVYLIKIRTENGIISEKIIKQ